MRTMIFTVLAATAAMAAPSLASAQNYNYAPPPTQGCQQSVNNSRLAGGVIGAIGGAVLGKQIAGRNARSEGQVLGAVVGAVAGSEIGRRRVACDDIAYRGNQPAPRQSSYQNNGYGYSNYPSQGYNNNGYNNGYQDRAYQASYRPPVQQRQQCGWGEQSVRNPNGSYQTQNVWMCQANDGNWYPANR
jgi:Glycine zipper 2TM domain